MTILRPIETVLREQRRAVENEISRLKQELEKIDAFMRQAASGASVKALAEKPGPERIEQGEFSIDIDSRPLTERSREQIREILPTLGTRGYTVSEFADALSRNGVHIKNKMLSTILWRMAHAGEIEKIGTRRQTHWRLPQQEEAPESTKTPGASNSF